MEKGMSINFKIRVFPVIIGAFGVLLMLALWIVRLNLIAVISALYCCIVSALLFLGTVTRKRINIWYFYGYVAASFGITMYYIVWGADASFGMRLLSNIGLALPSFIVILFLYYVSLYVKKHRQVTAAVCLSVALILTSVVYALTMNLKSKPKVFSLQKGHDEYLAGVDADKTKANSPNVLFILMDDLGYGDISRYGAIFDTPNIDSIADNGLYFENFYATYSVCSPSRFAAMTGRYPYRGYADNVMYPTEKCFVPFSMTRHYNSFELGNNVDGMLGDEITVAETFKAAGYNTGAIGKWHLGDYGQYLPTNQGFDYFYGSYQVNDMTPYYFVTEQNGEATPDPDFTTAKLRESQAGVTKKLHEEMTAFITDAAEGDAPFFAYYSTPWPHAPLSVGEEFDGATGLGVYADCVTEFDYYLGELFETMKELGVYDNTVIVFTSDNGPALQGSTGELRGGKYLAYEGGQKVPFMMKWEANPEAVGAVTGSATRVEGSAVLVDLYPTLVELAGITGNNGRTLNYMPFDREIDGVSMIPMLTGEKDYIHGADNPILYMKREQIKGIQYTIDTDRLLEINQNYSDYEIITDNDWLQFKYFKKMQNDNPAFFNLVRKNWLHIITDDSGENYNRADVYPEIAAEMKQAMEDAMDEFKANRRGVNKQYYK